MKELIEEFLKSGNKEVALPHMIGIQPFDELLQELGFEELEMNGDETNGWQIDFWYTWNHPSKGKYMLSGSLHYGDFVFSKK